MKNRLVFIIVPLILLALALVSGFVLLWRLFFLSLLVILLSYLWAHLSIRGISGESRKSSEYCQVGEYFCEEVTVFNRSKLPKLLVSVQENTTLPGYRNAAAFNLSPQGSYHWQSQVYCQRRGRYSIGSFTLTVSDPFGFFSLRRTFGVAQNILIYPATLELPFFQPLSSNEPGGLPDRWIMREEGQNAARVREFTSGDSLRHIHWHSTAHSGKLMVTEFDADHADYTSRDIWIIPDLHQAPQMGDGDETTEEYSITITASLVKEYAESGRRVGLIASGDRPYFFQPETGGQHLWQILDTLALMKATGNMPVDQLISAERERFGTGSAVIIITPSVSEETLASFHRLKQRGAKVVIILLDGISFGGTVSAARAASSLLSSDLQVYVVRRGDDLARTLDSRTIIPQLRYG
ncbi:MAG: DUF58 domain-containing protein [Dehalococcoidales bacterium]|nr:DUF58 domain-containing protein [Dehalococcoidales bacterium]